MFMLAMMTMQNIRLPIDPNANLTFPSDLTLYTFLKATYPPYWMAVADFSLLAILTLVLFVRFLTCPSCKEFFSDNYNRMELIGLLPQWIPCTIILLTGAVVLKAPKAAEHFMFVLAIWKANRVIPFVRALRHYRGIRLMGMALRASLKELLFLTIVLFVGSLLFGYALYLTELWSTNTQVYGVPDAMWWGIVTMTTVGYGDVVPTTMIGKVVGFTCAVTGILMVALPVPIIAANFYQLNEYVRIADMKTALDEVKIPDSSIVAIKPMFSSETEMKE